MRTVAIINDTSSERHHGCSAVMAAIEQGCRSAGLEIVLRHPVGTDWRHATTKAKICEADLVIVNGEGSIHHDNHRAEALCAIAPFCKAQGIPAVLINAGLHSLSRTLRDLSLFSLVYVRDNESARLLQSAGIRSEWTGDLSFTFDLSEQVPTAPSTTWAFTDSVLRPVSVHLQQDARLFGADFLPMRLSSYAPDYQSYIRLMAACGFVVTGRFHGACLCLNAEIPFAGITSNTNKLESLALDVWHTKRRVFQCTEIHSLRSRLSSLFERATTRPTDGRRRKKELDAALKPLLTFDTDELAAIRRYKERARNSISRMWADIREIERGKSSGTARTSPTFKD